jgi:flagellar basal-body rod protein FlgB
MKNWWFLYTVVAISCMPQSAKSEPLFDELIHEIDYFTERDKVISKNIANSDTPHYMPQDLEDFPQQSEVLRMALTNDAHMISDHSYDYRVKPGKVIEIKPNGNGVNVNLEMQQKGENAMALHEVTTIYSKMRGLMKTAINGSSR